MSRLARLLMLLAGLFAATQAHAASLNQRVFDKAWSLVGKRYWDPAMGGNDWNAIRDEHYPRAMAARDEKQLYAAINRMLDQLGDSHVYATPPRKVRWSEDEEVEEREMSPARRATMIDGGLLLLTLNQFDPGDDRWLAKSIAEAPALRGVILDLRDNPGGRDDVLDKVAGLFTTRRQLLIRLTGKKVIEERTRGAGPNSYQGPLAIIVGPNTASAAEILAFFLGESGRALTVGERSAGAVTGGVDHDLPGGGKLTIAEYDIRTANGTRLEGNGFTPKYRVPAATRPRDLALEKAAALLRGGRGRTELGR